VPAPPRVAIDAVRPQIDGGRYAVKRIVGEPIRVSARVYADGHDRTAAALLFRAAGEPQWREQRMQRRGLHAPDLFEAEFVAERLGVWEYCVEGWIDGFASWREGLAKKVEAGLDVSSELLEGAALVRAAETRASGVQRRWLEQRGRALADASRGSERARLALEPELLEKMDAHPDRARAARSQPTLRMQVERERAAVGAWYELFPRSCAREPGRHGTLRDCEARLPYIASLGFDVVYLPPIHPIGVTQRKGANNAARAAPGDPGSPWAIGSADGGHDAVHPQLGTLEDFERLVARARALGLEVALDLAFQCSPDHPWVAKHPGWFHLRPDGSIQYAENPPKKYQDIYPLDFDSEQWQALWEELRGVVRFWIARGVRIFRVDNPHTKPFAFWEWLLREIRSEHPDVVFLSEAFTRPAVMYQLAKLGFSQSYTYFTWRNTKRELIEYLGELRHTEVREYLRPNLFANTPDILHEFLQTGGRAAFQIRLVLAATLAGSYGIYGPPFELCVADAVPGTEEYADSEKYQIRHWDLERPDSLRGLITRLNELRRESVALLQGELEFFPTDHEELLAYGRLLPGGEDSLVVVVNLNPHLAQAGRVELPLERLGLDERRPYQMDDLLGGARYLWHGARNYVALDPRALPAHLFRVRRHLRTERDFDYYL
jgi:starch synthase (maltosyl-transferring)